MKLARNILLVDDEAQWLRSLSLTLTRLVPEATLDTCVDSRQVVNRMLGKDYSLVLLDLTMPFHSGEQLLGEILERHPNTRVIIVTGVNEVETAVRCIRAGAYDYFIKTSDVDELAASVRRALEVVGLERSYQQIKERFLGDTLAHPDAFSQILTCEPAMLDRMRYVEALSFSSEPVLLQGPCPELQRQFASALQQLINPEKQLLSLDLDGMDEQQLKLMLCGRVAGIDGSPAQAGLLHQARDSALLFQGLERASLPVQGLLLKLLQRQQYYPVGAERPQPLACRLLFGFNGDLQQQVEQQLLRSDLYYRLKGHRLQLPLLRQRRLDLPLLINDYIEQAANQMQRQQPLQPTDLAQRLVDYQFPGELQELKGMVFDAVSRSDHQLNIAPFLEAINEQRQPVLTDKIRFGEALPTLAEMNQLLLQEAMSRTAHNQTAAAKLLGISQSALSRRLAKSDD